MRAFSRANICAIRTRMHVPGVVAKGKKSCGSISGLDVWQISSWAKDIDYIQYIDCVKSSAWKDIEIHHKRLCGFCTGTIHIYSYTVDISVVLPRSCLLTAHGNNHKAGCLGMSCAIRETLKCSSEQRTSASKCILPGGLGQESDQLYTAAPASTKCRR